MSRPTAHPYWRYLHTLAHSEARALRTLTRNHTHYPHVSPLDHTLYTPDLWREWRRNTQLRNQRKRP